MHREDRSRVRSDCRLDPARVQIAGLRFDVNKYGPGAGVKDGVGSRHERHRRRDNLISRPDVVREQRQMEGGCAACEPNDMRRAEVCRELVFEVAYHRAGGQEQRFEDFRHRRDLVGPNAMPEELDASAQW